MRKRPHIAIWIYLKISKYMKILIDLSKLEINLFVTRSHSKIENCNETEL